MKKRVDEELGSKAKRKGLRRPQANVSWQIRPVATLPALHRAEQRCARVEVQRVDAFEVERDRDDEHLHAARR